MTTRWTRAAWRERPGQFALIIMSATLASTIGAHLLAGEMIPGLMGALQLVVVLAALGLMAHRFAAGRARLVAFLGAGQFFGHLALSGTMSHVSWGARSPGVAADPQHALAPCSAHDLHDLSKLSLPSGHASFLAGLASPMFLAHAVGIVVAALGARALNAFAQRARAWLAATRRRLRTRLVLTVRFTAQVGYVAPAMPRRTYRIAPLRGPPAAA